MIACESTLMTWIVLTTDILDSCAFERQVPHHLRCRAALLALPSVHTHSEAAIAASPEVSKRDLPRTFEVSAFEDMEVP